MKKVMMLLIVGAVLASAIPSVWAGAPVIKVQDPQPATSFLSYLLGLFSWPHSLTSKPCRDAGLFFFPPKLSF
jgi:hypothetical protein